MSVQNDQVFGGTKRRRENNCTGTLCNGKRTELTTLATNTQDAVVGMHGLFLSVCRTVSG